MIPIKLPDDALPEISALLTLATAVPDELPILTEIVPDNEDQSRLSAGFIPDDPRLDSVMPSPCALGEEEIRQLLQQLEIHLENQFAHKLSLNLEQLQRQAVEQAVAELKAELPKLLRDALNTHTGL